MWNKGPAGAGLCLFLLFLIENGLRFVWPEAPFSLAFIGVVFYGVREGSRFGFLSGLFAGFLLDLLGPGKIGHEMLILSSIGFAAGLFSRTVFLESFFARMVLPVILLVLARLFQLPQAGASDGNGVFFLLDLRPYFWTMVLSPFVFLLLARGSGARGRRRAGGALLS